MAEVGLIPVPESTQSNDASHHYEDSQDSQKVIPPTLADLQRAVRRVPRPTRFGRMKTELKARLAATARTPVSGNTARVHGVGSVVPTMTTPQKQVEVEKLPVVQHREVDDEPSHVVVQNNTVGKFDETSSPLQPTVEHILRAQRRGGQMPKRFMRNREREQRIFREAAFLESNETAHGSTPSSKTITQENTTEKHELIINSSARREVKSGAIPHASIAVNIGTDDQSNSQDSATLEAVIKGCIRSQISQKGSNSTGEGIPMSVSFGSPRLVHGSKGQDSAVNERDVNDSSDKNDQLDDIDVELLNMADHHDDFIDIHREQQHSQLSSVREDFDMPDTQRDLYCATQEDVMAEIMKVGLTRREKAAKKPMKTYGKAQQSKDPSSKKVHIDIMEISQAQQPKKQKLPRRLPDEGLYLVSERLQESDSEDDDEEASFELPDDPISQIPEEMTTVETVQAKEHKKSRRAPRNYRSTFGIIDTSKYRIVKPHSIPPKEEGRRKGPSFSDGFVGSEARPIGIHMPLPKPRRARGGTTSLSMRIGSLTLVESRDEESGTEQFIRTKKHPSKKATRSRATIPAAKPTPGVLPAPVNLSSLEPAQPETADQSQLYEQPFVETILNNDNIPFIPLPRDSTSPGEATFDADTEGVDRSQPPSGSEAYQRAGSFEKGDKSLENTIEQEPTTMPSDQRYESGEDEDESECSSAGSTSSEPFESFSDDEKENERVRIEYESGENSQEDNEESDEGCEQENTGSETSEKEDEEDEEEEEDEREAGMLAVAGNGKVIQDTDVPLNNGDATIASSRYRRSQSEEAQAKNTQSEELQPQESQFQESQVEEEPQFEDGSQFEELQLEESQFKHVATGPFEDFLLEESTPMAVDDEIGSQSSEEQQYSQLLLDDDEPANTQASWRPRRPKTSTVLNETEEDIVESPIVSFTQRRISGLQSRRRRTHSRPLTLTTSRPATPEVPETQAQVILSSPGPEIAETQASTLLRSPSPEIPETQAQEFYAHYSDGTADAQGLEDTEENPMPSSQMSFIPAEKSYYSRASRELHVPDRQSNIMRTKSTPARFHPNHLATSAVRIYNNTPISRALLRCTSTSPIPQQLLTPKSLKSLKDITKRASSTLGTLDGSARKRLKSLPFTPPFKR